MAFSTHDIVPDSPTNNFATLNSLNIIDEVSTFSEGNLKVTTPNSGKGTATSTIEINGKMYAEFLYSATGGALAFFGVSRDGGVANFYGADIAYLSSGAIYEGGVTASVVSYTTGDIIGLSYDSDTGDYEFFKNGSSIQSGTYVINQPVFAIQDNSNNYDIIAIFNFGQDPTFAGAKSPTTTYTDANGIGAFHYQPPTGALALCTANLPDFTPTVTGDTPQEYFKAVTYTGNVPANNTTSSQNIDLGILADLIWIKDRNSGTNYNHGLFDSVRGFDKWIGSNTPSAQDATANAYLSYVSGTTYNIGWSPSINSDTHKKIAWCWKAGGSPSATDDGTGVSGSAKLVNTSGVASSTTCKSFKDAAVTAGASNVKCPSKMSINQAAGFSIVKYVGDGSTGSTVPHGLLEAPQIVIVKPFNGAVAFGWRVYTEMTGNTQHLLLNTSDYASTYTDWNNTSPTSNVFTSSDAQTTNHDGTEYIAYCWHSVEGYSKFGSYTGNGSTDGPFVYCGFRPAFVMIKNADATSNWSIFDSARDESNVVGRLLMPNLSNQEQDIRSSHYPLDFLSNGFKLRTDLLLNVTNINLSNTYIFMAFAEQPFKFSNAR